MGATDRLLERDAVLTELERQQRVSAGGCGQVVLLRGEAGVGKTTVIARFIAGLGERARVLRGWCDPLSAPLPLGPARHARGPRGGPREWTARSHRSPRLGSDLCPFDRDVPWRNRGGVRDRRRALGRRRHTGSAAFSHAPDRHTAASSGVSYRDDEIGEQHPLAVLLGDLATSRAVTRINLEPLSTEAVAELAAGSGFNAEALHRLTDGNAFFVTEVLTAGTDPLIEEALPRSVSEAVRGRLARLSAAGRETAHVIAVWGPRADLDFVRQLCPSVEDGLVESLNAGVLVAHADTVGFRHELARRATLDQIPTYQRRLRHKQALTALAEPPIDPDKLASLAFHATQAGHTDAIIGYAPAAAARAASLGANREAAELYALTLRHAAAVSDEQKVKWLEQHGLVSFLSGLLEASVGSFQHAATLRHALGDRRGEGDNRRWQSHVLVALGRRAEALQVSLTSLRLLEAMGPCPPTRLVADQFGRDDRPRIRPPVQ